MRNSLCVLFLACLYFSPAPAQNRVIDSLNAVIRNAKNDTTVAAAYTNLSDAFFASHPDTVIPLCTRTLEIVDKNIRDANPKEKHSYLSSKADALNNIATIMQVRGDLDKALDYYNQALKIHEENGSWQQMPIMLNNIGVVYYKQGQTQKSLDAYHQSLTLREKLGDKAGVAQSLSNIGVIYINQGQPDMALDYFRRSLDIRRKINDRKGMVFSLNNIGAIYREQKKMDLARSYYNQCLEICIADDNKEGLANSYHNIGGTYELDQPEKAIEYFHKSLELYASISDKRGIANSSVSIAKALVLEGKPKDALEYGNRSLDAAQAGGYAETIRNAHLVLTSVDSALGNTQGAFEHYKQYIFYRDSIANEKTRKEAIRKKLQHDYEIKEAVLKSEQDEKLRRQKLVNWFTGASLGLVLLSSFLFFNRRQLKQKHKFQKEQASAVMETQEQERKRIAEDLHDSLGHLLSTVKLNLQTLPANQRPLAENSLQLLNQASSEIRNITFDLMPRTLEEAGLVPALQELASKVANSGTIQVGLNVHGFENFTLEKQAQFNIYRIVQEALNNIAKHAGATHVSVLFEQRPDDVTVIIEDDGRGFDPDLAGQSHSRHSGMGLVSMRERAAQFDGSVQIESAPGQGTTVFVRIPTPPAPGL